MSEQVILPQVGFEVGEATVAEWLVADGDTVQKGQPLFSLESDKSTQEIESPASGTIKILMQVGGPYPIGSILAEIS
jgi:pyruvate/2-oxoglutarate dehydrogenase complex dihydrolipoamide acyltransferase (E2) component